MPHCPVTDGVCRVATHCNHALHYSCKDHKSASRDVFDARGPQLLSEECAGFLSTLEAHHHTGLAESFVLQAA